MKNASALCQQRKLPCSGDLQQHRFAGFLYLYIADYLFIFTSVPFANLSAVTQIAAIPVVYSQYPLLAKEGTHTLKYGMWVETREKKVSDKSILFKASSDDVK